MTRSPVVADAAAFHGRVRLAIDEIVRSRADRLRRLGDGLDGLNGLVGLNGLNGLVGLDGPNGQDALDDLFVGLVDDLGGGKLLRPTFCASGWRAAGGDPEDPALAMAAASLELMHVSALVHDDVLDGSDTRRGKPSAFRRFAVLHTERGWSGSAAAFGTAGAVLLGDLLLGWSGEALRTCGLPPTRLGPAMDVYDRMRDEVIGGQYLDMATQAAGTTDVGAALRVVELKSARYTVQRPLELGAVLAGGTPDLVACLAGYGRPVGTAFQLRDDLLGLLGDPGTTGKPVGDDIREGKRTVLLASVYELADEQGRALLDRSVGDPALDDAGVRAVQRLVQRSGAEARVETLIAEAVRAGLDALARVPVVDPAVLEELTQLAHAVSTRQA